MPRACAMNEYNIMSYLTITSHTLNWGENEMPYLAMSRSPEGWEQSSGAYEADGNMFDIIGVTQRADQALVKNLSNPEGGFAHLKLGALFLWCLIRKWLIKILIFYFSMP